MRQVVNFFITGLIFWVGWEAFPNYVWANGAKSILIAVVIFYVVGTLVAMLVGMLALMMILVFGNLESLICVIIIFIVAIFTEFLALVIVSNVLSGFEVVGFWPKMILAFCCSVCTTSVKLGDYRE